MSPLIVVVCPGDVVSGGPEALHQLVDMANHIEPGVAAICYTPFESSFEKSEAYSSYNAPIISRERIPRDAVVVIPEVFPKLVCEFDQRCVLWWLSVDNFPNEYVGLLNFFELHAVQSEYALVHLRKMFQLRPMMLSDYIHVDFASTMNHAKQELLALNPAKGAALIEEFKSINPGIPVAMLENLSRLQLKEALSDATVFVDFGHHPGKDRLPREAALQNVVVFVRRAGAALFSGDVPLSDEYQFDDYLDLGSKIHQVFQNYHYHLDCQSSYRDHVASQQEIFRAEVSQFLVACKGLPRPLLKVEVVKDYRERNGELFHCPICSDIITTYPHGSEESACTCGATWNDQASVLLIRQGVRQWGSDSETRQALSDHLTVGLGINDSWQVDRRLSSLFRYTNTYHRQFPTFDVNHPPESVFGHFDFVSCPNALDYSPAPASNGLSGILKVLKPGGFALFGVPSSGQVETEEYYPGLKEWFLKDGAMYWWDEGGTQHRHENPKLCGAGEPVMRRWSIHELVARCQEVGFGEIGVPENLPPRAQGALGSNFGSFVIARR